MTRVALVTGAVRGIGAATVRALAARDWAVLALDQCADDPCCPTGSVAAMSWIEWWPGRPPRPVIPARCGRWPRMHATGSS